MSTVSSTQSASSIQSDYLNLLVKQLQNQDPTDPMDNNQMASNLAQLSQLQQTENMAATFKSVLASTQQSQAASMIGKTITFTIPNSNDVYQGVVQKVDLTGGQVRVVVGNYEVQTADIQSISN